MLSKHKIAIIGFDTLHQKAIVDIISNEYDNFVYCINKTILDNKDCSLYIITPEIYIENLNFFLPKKGKVLIITSQSDINLELSDSINFISTFSDLEFIKNKIYSIISTLKNQEKTNNELTDREIEVLKEIATGKIIKEIADTLNISVNTVLTHRKNISSKLGIRSVSGLSVYATINGILE